MRHRFGILLGVVLLSAAGCSSADVSSLLASALLDDIARPSSIVGEDGQGRLLVAVRVEPVMLNSLPPNYDIYAINPSSFESELMFNDVKAFPYEVRATGDYVAWNDSASAVGVVHSLVDGHELRVPIGPDGPHPPGGVVFLAEDTVVFHAVRSLSDSVDPVFDYVVLNLANGEQIVISDVWDIPSFAMAGDYAIFAHVNEPVDVSLLGLEYRGHIDVVDLRSGQRRAVERNIRTNGGGFFAIDGVFVWQQFKPGSFESEALSYDPLTARLETLVTALRGDAIDTLLHDARRDELLIERNFTSRTSETLTVLELRSFSGETTRLAEFEHSPLEPFRFWLEPRFTAGGLVTWNDPHSDDLVFYDPADQSSRRFDPTTLRE